MADGDDLPPDVNDLSDTDFNCMPSSSKKPRTTTPVPKDSHGTPKPSGTPVVSAAKTGETGAASSSQQGDEVIQSKTGRGYLKVSPEVVVGCSGNFRKNFHIAKLGGKQIAIDTALAWLTTRQQQPAEKKTQSDKEPHKPPDKESSKKTEKSNTAADTKKKNTREKPDADTIAKQKEENQATVDQFQGPANSPKPDDTWNSFVAWRTKELREAYAGKAQAVYFGICAKEWRARRQ